MFLKYYSMFEKRQKSYANHWNLCLAPNVIFRLLLDMPKTTPKRTYKIAKPLKEGLEITDGGSNTWVVGEAIGQGGFGCIYAG